MELYLLLAEGKRQASGNAELLLYEIDAGAPLCHGMFHLNTRVNLEEVETAVRAKQELGGAGIDIGDGANQLNRCLRHAFAQLFIDGWGRRFFDELLVTALDAALALAEVHHVAMRICNELHLDMTSGVDGFLKVDAIITEGAPGLAACCA